MSIDVQVPPAKRGDPSWPIVKLWPVQGDWSDGDFFALSNLTSRQIELTDGCVEVLDIPTRTHQKLTRAFADILDAFIKPKGQGETVLAAYPVRLWPGRIREPDVVFTLAQNAHKAAEEFADGADLVVEVVSQDRNRDLVEKRADYQQAEIPEYWIIDADKQRVLVFALVNGVYIAQGDVGRGQIARSALLPGFEVDVSSLFDSAK